MRGHAIIPRVQGSISSKWYSFYRNPTLNTIGHDMDGATGGLYKRSTTGFYITKPFVVISVKIKIDAAETYKIALVDGTGSSPADVYVFTDSLVATGGLADETINVSPNILLKYSKYYPSVYCETSVTMSRSAVGTNYYAPDESWATSTAFYDGASSSGASIPFRFVGYWLETNGLKNYSEFPII